MKIIYGLKVLFNFRFSREWHPGVKHIFISFAELGLCRAFTYWSSNGSFVKVFTAVGRRPACGCFFFGDWYIL